MIQKLWNKYKGIFYYGVFGVLTTVVNVVSYSVCYDKLGILNVPSTVIAWVLAVIFAYVTNKIWVFNSPSWKKDVLIPEITKFISCRLVTGVLDVIIMFIGVDVLHGPGKWIKLGSNVLVIILNYVFSKLVIFIDKDKEEKNSAE